MSTDVLTLPDADKGQGCHLIDPHHKRGDLKQFKKAIDDGWDMPREQRSKVLDRLDGLLDDDDKRVRLGACKVYASLAMVNVNLMRIDQAQEQGPVQHNTQINLYGGQVITGSVIQGMTPAERDLALQSGAQLAPDAIASLSADEVQRLLRAAQSIPSQLQAK